MIDPIISLAFSIYSNKGVYALLLGSGISRAASIPTGWEIILDLTRQLAALEKEDCGESPETWYLEKYKEEPDYSKLLEHLAKTPDARNNLLKKYFEPIDGDETARKPTDAHRAIAQLIKKGYFKVVITTNFDRLLEKALEEIGITPNVIHSTDSIKGAMPIIHSPYTILKVHGDYMDVRIKNTKHELEKYDDELNNLLDRIFDEFGLIVCGWSAEWDIALRDAIYRIKNRRFLTYWLYKGDLGKDAIELITFRSGQSIKIESANVIFNELNEKIDALENINAQHPLSLAAKMEQLKKYISEDKYNIKLHDMIMNETKNLLYDFYDPNISRINFLECRNMINTNTETLRHLLAHYSYWSNDCTYLIKSLQELANIEKVYYNISNDIRLYPSLLSLYTAGISIIYQENYKILYKLFTTIKIWKNNEPENIITNYALSLHNYHWRRRQEMQMAWTPLSQHINETSRKIFIDLIPNDNEYNECFDRFEILFNMIYQSLNNHPELQQMKIGFLPGMFIWPSRKINFYNFGKEMEKYGADWTPLKYFFNNDYEEAKKIYDKMVIHVENNSYL